MGVSLLARSSLATRDRHALGVVRWTLIRRGVLLYTFGYFLNWIWPGTILFYYGAYFVVAAFLFTLRSRWLAVIGVAAGLAAAGLQWWVVDRTESGNPPRWFTRGSAGQHTSPRELVLDTFVRGTHPVLQWLVFLCAGMVLGRLLPFDSIRRVQLSFFGALCIALGYGLHGALPWHPVLRSTASGDRGMLYLLTAVGSSVIAVCIIGWIAEATASSTFTQMLAVTGRTTLSIYALHVVVFGLLVDWLGWIQPGGLPTSLSFAMVFWMLAIAFANAWNLWRPLGPLEWVYRRFSDDLP
jgi:uncharacterized membrane protein YeiB